MRQDEPEAYDEAHREVMRGCVGSPMPWRRLRSSSAISWPALSNCCRAAGGATSGGCNA